MFSYIFIDMFNIVGNITLIMLMVYYFGYKCSKLKCKY